MEWDWACSESSGPRWRPRGSLAPVGSIGRSYQPLQTIINSTLTNHRQGVGVVGFCSAFMIVLTGWKTPQHPPLVCDRLDQCLLWFSVVGMVRCIILCEPTDLGCDVARPHFKHLVIMTIIWPYENAAIWTSTIFSSFHVLMYLLLATLGTFWNKALYNIGLTTTQTPIIECSDVRAAFFALRTWQVWPRGLGLGQP